MDAYETLRRQAQDKRDAAIMAARKECRDSIRKINAISCRVGQVTPKRRATPGQPIIEMICDLIPQDRTFTFGEIVEQLQAVDPGRDFNLPSLRTFFQKLRDRGMIRRVSKVDGGCVLWAAAGFHVTDSPFGAMSLVDVAEAVLRDAGPLWPTELVLTIRERGYRSDADPRKLLNSLQSSLKRNRERFACGDDGRWSVGGH